MLLQKSKNVNTIPTFTLPEPALSNTKMKTWPIYLHEPYLLNVLKSGEVFPDIKTTSNNFFYLT